MITLIIGQENVPLFPFCEKKILVLTQKILQDESARSASSSSNPICMKIDKRHLTLAISPRCLAVHCQIDNCKCDLLVTRDKLPGLYTRDVRRRGATSDDPLSTRSFSCVEDTRRHANATLPMQFLRARFDRLARDGAT